MNSDAYDNSIIHRSVSNFVIQGGGFEAPTVSADQPGSDPVAIPTTGPVQNEPGNLNTRGTIAMAKLGGQPDSATSQFFFNLSDNSFLDSDNGGYTQFGSVLGSGMTVVDTIGSAFTYDATTYYSNTALSDLPLWNVNEDNIVLPQDFVQIENADAVTESALFTYSASSSDSAKLTAALNSNGDLVLTRVGSATGTIDVTVTATSKLDNSTATDVFSVGLSGGENPGPIDPPPGPGPELTAIESNGTTVLNRDATGKLYAGNQPIFYNGVQVDVNRFPGYTLVGVEDFGSNGGKQVLFEKADGSYSLWIMTSSWAYQSNTLINANDTSAINAVLVKFGLADPAPTLFAIEEVGNTVLNKDQDGKLYAGDQPLYYGTTQLTETYFAAYAPVAVEDFGDGDKRFVLKHSTGSLLTFSMSSTWTRTGNLPWIETNDPTAFNAAELEWGMDFNNDGVTGRILTALESTGTALNKDQDGKLYAGDQPLYISGTTQLTETYFASYTPVAVEDFGDGDKRFVLKHSTGSLLTFSMSSTWTRTGNLPWIETADPTAFNTAEADYGIDFNNDGVTGRILTALESTGTALNKDQDGKLYAGDQPLYISGTTQLTETYFASYTPVAVEDFGAEDKRFVLKHSTGSLLTFSMSSTWTRTGNLPWIETDDPTAFNTAEADYGTDFDGDGDVSLIELENNGLALKKDLSGKLYADDQPLYISGTTQLTETYFASYTPVAVEDFGDGDKRFVLKHTTGSLLTFSMSSTWTRTGNLPWIETDDPTAFNTAEADYGTDFDGDGDVSLIELENNGLALKKDLSGKLYADDQPLYISGTTQLTETYFAAYTPVAVEDFGDGDKRFVLKHSTGSLLTFSMSATWTRTGNLPWIETNDPTAFNAAELEYGVDFDDDGNTGLIFTPIETAGSTALRRDQSGRLYAGSQPIYLSGTTQLTETYFATYTPVAVEDFGDGDKRFVLKHSTGSLLTFSMSATWTRTGNLPWIEVDDSVAFNAAEAEYGLDFDGDA